MPYKLFPHSHDGKDQFRLTFDTIDEREAFDRATKKLRELAENFDDLMVNAGGRVTCPTLEVLDGCEFKDHRTTEAYGSGFSYSMTTETCAAKFTTLEREIIRDKLSVVQKMFPYHVFNWGGMFNWFMFAEPLEKKEPMRGGCG